MNEALATELAHRIGQVGAVTVVTGAGMSAESGIPTFRGTHDSLWSRFDPMTLATETAWRTDRALVWGKGLPCVARRAARLLCVLGTRKREGVDLSPRPSNDAGPGAHKNRPPGWRCEAAISAPHGLN